jgi:hypothetical protein
VRLDASLGPNLAGLAVDREQPVVEEAGTGVACERGGGFRCGTVRRVGGMLVDVSLPLDRAAPGSYRVDRRSRRVAVARPPRRLRCFDADPVPGRHAVLWVGAGTISTRGAPRPTPRVRFEASARGRAHVRGTLRRSASGRWRWRKLRLGARDRGCGRTWTLRYRVGSRSIATFRVRIGRA